MKDRRYANRGQPFEEFLRYVNDRYAYHDNLAAIEKLPTEFIPLRDRTGRVCNVKVEHRSKVDFIGRYKSYPIAIEAKHTSNDLIRFDAVQPHQADYMDAFTAAPGTIGLVVVSFNLTRFFAIPWAFWKAAYDTRVRPGASRTRRVEVEAFGDTWVVPQKFSARVEDLNPSWEVHINHKQYGLHYLERADQYITQPTAQP